MALHLHHSHSYSNFPYFLFFFFFFLLYGQAWSGGQYKHVIGRPIFKGENHKDYKDCISMAFLYSPPTISSKSSNVIIKSEKTISLGHQAILAILLSLAYYFLVYIYKKF